MNVNANLPPESQFTNYVDYIDAIRRTGYSQRWRNPVASGFGTPEVPAAVKNAATPPVSAGPTPPG